MSTSFKTSQDQSKVEKNRGEREVIARISLSNFSKFYKARAHLILLNKRQSSKILRSN